MSLSRNTQQITILNGEAKCCVRVDKWFYEAVNKMIDTLRKIDAYLCAELGFKWVTKADLDAQIAFNKTKLEILKRTLDPDNSNILRCEQELNALIAERIAEYGG